VKFKEDTKKFIFVNLARLVLSIVIFTITAFHYKGDLIFYTAIPIFFSLVWFFVYHFGIINPDEKPNLEYIPIFIDILMITFWVYLAGGINTFFVAGFFYATAIASLNTRIHQGLFSAIFSCFMFLAFTLLIYYEVLLPKTIFGYHYEIIFVEIIVANIINIAGNFAVYFSIHGLVIRNEKLLTESDHAKKKAEDANRMKNEILANMSHEIRTPMNAILGITNALIEDTKDFETKESLGILKFSADQLLVILNDILDLSKIEEGKIDLEEIDFSLKKLMDNIVLLNSGKAKEKKIYLQYEFDSSIPNYIVGDPTRLAQILNNLINNAIKFTEKGGVLVKIILLKKTLSNISIHFLIKDSGLGVPLDKQKSIFEKFTQASTETTRKFGGTGLGLSIVKKLIQLMDSDIGLKSELGLGSEFYFMLNFKVSEKESTNSKIPALNTDSKDLEQHCILLVDDNEINIKVAMKFLKKWKAEVIVANNGEAAIEVYQKEFSKIDIVLMDLQMPIMDGYEASQKIIEFQKDKNLQAPIIALTADAMKEVEEKIKKIGIVDLITKPFKPDDLYLKIKRNLLKL
jgi:signal transduction histidine kinase/CheY-like chemotaxis protein